MDSIQDRSERPSPADLKTFLPWASLQLEAKFDINITKRIQSKYLRDRTKQKTKVKRKTESDSNIQMSSDSQADWSLHEVADRTIYMETIHNEHDDIVRIQLLKNKNLPRKIFQILALAIPYHKALTSLIVNDGLHAKAIYEISKFYYTNKLTEICLDGTKLPEANYHILLDNDIIKHFSLSKCNITDAVVKTIASKLTSTSPAATSLSVLNLSTNRITDVGVKYLAEMLRSNRQLSYLNLADNAITDEGAESIFNTLTKFALTSEEVLDRSRTLASYLKEKNKILLETVQDLNSHGDKKNGKRKLGKLVSTKKKLVKDASVDLISYNSVEGSFFEKASIIVDGILGPLNYHFSLDNTESEENVTYCLGNNTLSYLNLAYNNLSYFSVKKLCDVLQSQTISCRTPKGLINIRIEGNCLPKSCKEFQTIDNLLLPGLKEKLKTVESHKRRANSISK